ncbi:MAG: ribosome silencing factor [Christensenellaceae bacterium]|nr:ribosome silencing factor [Christensenellaceae bacterium]
MVFSKRVKEVAKILDDKKASEVLLLDVSGSTIMADYFVVCSGNSNLHVRRLAEDLDDELIKLGYERIRVEGLREGRWVVADYGDILVHIFHKDEREFYDIERLWKNGDNYLEYEG